MTLKNRNRFSEGTMRKDKLLQCPLRAAARFDLRIRRSMAQRAGNIKRNAPFPAVQQKLVQPDCGTNVDAALGRLRKDAQAQPRGQRAADARQDDKLIEMATFGHHKSSKNRRRLIAGNSATGICDRTSFPHHDVNCVVPNARSVFADGGRDPYSCKLEHAFDCERAES
ncbi:hypothetical protein [Mesorhizobium sp.]|uniref:hypothetical protein n=1 Tax=Mesorhizobium sp. TaxID=1871066 RepID=UPI00351A4E37